MSIRAVVIVVSLVLPSSFAFAQGAGAGAEYNNKERARQQEIKRIKDNDKPLRDDPIGNALTGGAATGLIRGAGAGAANVGSRTLTGTGAGEYKRRNEKDD